MRTVRKCDFDFLTKWFYPVFRKTILPANTSIGQYLDHVIEELTGELLLLYLWSKYAYLDQRYNNNS